MPKQTKLLFLSILLLMGFTTIYGQEKLDALRDEYKFYLLDGKLDSALDIARTINLEAAKLKSDSENIYAISFLLIADILYEKGYIDSAILFYSFSENEFETRKETNHNLYLYCLNQQGNLFLELGEYKEAKKRFLKSFNIIKNNENECAECGDLADKIGLIYLYLNEFDSSLYYAHYELNVIEKKEGKKTDSYNRVLLNIAEVYNRLNKCFEADSIFREIIDSYNNNNDSENCNRTDILLSYAKFQIENDQHYAALNILNKIDTSCLNEENILRCKKEIYTAMAYNGVGKYLKAIQLYENMLQNKKNFECIKEGDIYANLAISYYSIGDFEKSEKYNLIGLSTPSHFEDSATSYYNLSLTKSFENKWLEAIKYADSALIKTHRLSLKARIYTQMSECFVNIGEIDKGKSTIDKAIDLYVKNSMIENNAYADALVQKADILILLNQLDSAKHYLNYSIDIYKKYDLTSLTIYNSLLLRHAKIDLLLGQQPEAISTCSELLNNMIQNTRDNFIWLNAQEKEKLWKIYSDISKGIVNIISNCSLNNPLVTELLFNEALFSKSLLLDNIRLVSELVANSKNTAVKSAYEQLGYYRSVLLKNDLMSEGNLPSLKIKMKTIDSLEKIMVNYSSKFQLNSKISNINWKDITDHISTTDGIVEFSSFFRFKRFRNKVFSVNSYLRHELPKSCNIR